MSKKKRTNDISANTGRISVVIPTHNEAGAISDVIRKVKAHTPSLAEVLIIDDGSTDGTADIAEKSGARVIRLPVNQGKGNALRLGIDESEGEILVFIDGDGQDDPGEIPMLLDALQPGVDMVIGSRFMGRFQEGAITALNRLGSHCLTATLNGLYGSGITDPFAGFRVLRRASISDCNLSARRYDIEVDVLIALLQRGRHVVEIPVNRYARTYGSTGLSSFRDGTRILWRIVSRRVGLS